MLIICVSQDHLETCNKFPLPCPNSCGDSVPREMVICWIALYFKWRHRWQSKVSRQAIATYYLAMWQVRTLATMYVDSTYIVVCFERLELNSLLNNNNKNLCVCTHTIYYSYLFKLWMEQINVYHHPWGTMINWSDWKKNGLYLLLRWSKMLYKRLC